MKIFQFNDFLIKEMNKKMTKSGIYMKREDCLLDNLMAIVNNINSVILT